MNIGQAVKQLRKNKGYQQNELSLKIGISVNSLSMIETNQTFPQKKTINAICNALEIPVSYLLFFSIDLEDVPEEKRAVFEVFNNSIKTLLLK